MKEIDMKTMLTVRYALMCLQSLDAVRDHWCTAQEVSRDQGVPLAECATILHRLSAAGLVEEDDQGRYTLPRPLSELRALEVLSAATLPVKTLTRFRMLVGPDRGPATRKTLEAVALAHRFGLRPADNGGM
jgi:DNA-binding IscR family transcriptional regulator